jgi:hypothetical protein
MGLIVQAPEFFAQFGGFKDRVLDHIALQAVQAQTEYPATFLHRLVAGFGGGCAGVGKFFQVLFENLCRFALVTDRRQSHGALHRVHGTHQRIIDDARQTVLFGFGEPVIQCLEILRQLLDHQLDQGRIHPFEFGCL